MTDPTRQRGYLNNNPGNIDRSDPPWNGEIRDVARCQNDCQRIELEHGRFGVFETAEAGLRAFHKTLLAHQNVFGDRTIDQHVERWAPTPRRGLVAKAGTEAGGEDQNDHEAYVATVCAVSGFDRDQPLDMNDADQACRVMRGMVTQELGGQPYVNGEIERGVSAA